jgi:Membrane transport protein MerF
MGNDSVEKAKRCYKAGLWGAVVAAVCCVTPVLVIGLGFLGFAGDIPYLDRVLFPLLGICLILAAYGWWRMKQCGEESNAVKNVK